MFTYLIRRILLMIPTLLVISALVFLIIQLPPGDYLSNQMSELQSQGDSAAADKLDFLRKQHGLDQPMVVQYLVWLGVWPGPEGFSGLLQGDLGFSFEYSKPVNDVVGDRIWLSVIVSLATILFTWVVAFPIGVYSATHQYSWGDHGLTFIGFLGLATPKQVACLRRNGHPRPDLVTFDAAGAWMTERFGQPRRAA